MPYKIAPYKDGFRVHKLNADDSLGEAMSGKPMSKRAAQAQMRALYASEKKEAPAIVVEPEVYEQATLGEIKKATETKMYDDGPMMMGGGPCSWEEMDAREQAHELYEEAEEMNWKLRQMTDNIMANAAIEDKATALMDLAKGYAERIASMKMEPETKEWTPDNLKADRGEKAEPAPVVPASDLFIWKEGGEYKWLTAYSNNRRDDDSPPEIISSASHKDFDLALEKGDWPMPELWPWHVEFPVGRAYYHAYDESTGFPVAAGGFYPGMEWAAEGMMKAGWKGVSHGMPTEEIRRDKGDSSVIIRHRTKEISPLPGWAAANKLAFSIISKEKAMSDEKGLPAHKREEFVKAFGAERVEQIEAALTGLAKEADAAGIEKKEADPPQVPAEVPATQENEDMLAVVAELVRQNQALTAAVGSLAEEVKALKDDKERAVQEKAEETPAFSSLLAALKNGSVIGKVETLIDGRTKEAKDGPEEAEETLHPVPFLNNIMKANAKYGGR